MADDFGWEAMTLEGELEHRPNLVPVAPHCHLSLCDKAIMRVQGNGNGNGQGATNGAGFQGC
jgi:hypothetical protein